MIPSSFVRKLLIVIALVVCVFYLTYRVLFTLNLAGPYAITASVLLLVAEAFGILNLFLFFLQVWEVREPAEQPVLEGRTVDVFVPTYNEDTALLRATLEACVRMDYPHKTYVLDDGRRPEVEQLARELGIHYISRPDNRHFKAGNLNHAFERTDGEFVVVLDADHVPEPHFITRLIGYFRDERLGYVQTPHAFYNFDSFQARLDHKNRKYWEEGHLFYYVIQPGRNYWGCPIFAGSAAMFRRTAIRDVGLIATDTITEDMHTGLRMNAKGWRSLAITERLVAGQAAPDITTFHSQRLRWGTGNLSIMRYDNPLTVRGLTLAQRLCYLGSMLHWASGPFKLIIYLTPIAMLFSGIPPVNEFTWELLRVTVVYLVVSLTTLKLVSNGYGSIVNAELFSMVNFWTQIKATFRAIFGFGARHFHVTPKGAAATRDRRQRSVWPYIRPQTYLIILSVLALFWGWGRLVYDGEMILANYPQLANVPVLSWILKHSPQIGFGISDDYFKPVVPTIWVLIHFWLAYKVTQRAFWPAD
ncbi:MAG TPA: glycosyltransferase, partial [Gemmataceae bacterium]|nr:glycosyltransferase [Gemmataceae bacterium]